MIEIMHSNSFFEYRIGAKIEEFKESEESYINSGSVLKNILEIRIIPLK